MIAQDRSRNARGASPRSLRAGILAIAVALPAFAAGCAGGRAGAKTGPALPPPAPWDHALKPRSSPEVEAQWAEGHVEAISEDGLTVKIKIDRGEVRPGERASIFVRTVENPSPRYLSDETRELRAATAKVVRFEGYSLLAEILDESRRAPVAPGDRVIVRTP